MMHVFSLLERAAALEARSIATSDGSAERTYGEVARRVLARAGYLAARGVGAGERVAILDDNGAAYLEWTFAVAALGAVLVPLNTWLLAADLAFCLDDAEARWLVAGERLAPLAEGAVAAGAGTLAGWCVEEREGAHEHAPLDHAARPGPGDLAHLYYTSGTTGRPKGVMLSHGNVVSHATAAVIELALTQEDTWGHIAPMFHLADAWATLAMTLACGRHAFLPRFEAAAALALLEERGVTLTNLVPTMLVLMVEHESLPSRDLANLRVVLSGGAPIAPDVVRRIVERFGCDYVQTYGMTETSPYLTLSKLSREQRALPESERLRIAARTGRPFLGVELEVVDASGRTIPRDDRTVGEIRVRGATVTSGYWKRPDATADAIQGGWLHTGDLATIDETGSVNIVDRAKDMVITGGENVYTTEVEAVLYRHPHVLECAVFGRPDPVWGERVTAAIVTKPGAPFDESELAAHCRAHLAAFKVPRAFERLDALPRTGSGKIAKRLLRGA
jgi:fatty-acyl-CoA synthase